MRERLTKRIDFFGKTIERLVANYAIYHFIFWLIFYFFLIIVGNKSEMDLSTNMLLNFIRVFFWAILFYTNQLVLFPKYLRNNNILKFLLSLFLLVALITTLEFGFISLLSGISSEMIYYIFSFTFFIACVSTIFIIINDWYQQQREKTELQRQTLKSELRFLRSQINPHFLFNTLNSLYALTLKKSDQAPEIVLRLSEMMRYMLYECNERQVDLQKEVNYVKNYLELEKIRHSGKFDINFQLNGQHFPIKKSLP